MISRRALLRITGAGAAASAVAACTTHGGSRLRPSPTAASTTASPSPPSWAALKRTLSGRLSRPGDAGYDRARLLYNPRFDSVRPAGVAGCKSAADVAAAIAFARQSGMSVVARSGGHSYAGCSTTDGLVIDTRPMSSISVSSSDATATIGSGAALIDIYSSLASHGVSIPGGSCPTVGIAGLTLGGGYGVVGRAHGLTCDALVAAEVVLADGRTVRASASSEPDLFWALRGGGGTIGVVTSFTFRTHPTRDVTIFAMGWRWPDAAAVLAAWQQWGPTAPDATFSTCKLLATDTRGASQSPSVGVYGLHLGSAVELNGLLDDLARQVGAPPTYRSLTPSSYAAAMVTEAGCADLSPSACHLRVQGAGGQLEREAFIAGSDYLVKPLPAKGIQDLIAAVEKRQQDPSLIRGGTSFDAYGGAINRVAPAATAFVHRSPLAVLQHTATWTESASAAVVAANRRSLADLQTAVRPYASGEAYQNYLDTTLKDPGKAYFGANLARLQQVQRHYDPDGVFACPALGIG